MSDQFVQFAFSAGVLSDAFLARPDLEKFDLGLREGLNWLIDYRGGATVRPPLVFLDYTKEVDKAVRLQPFQFNTALANTYIMVFGHEYIQFMQNGSYITETPLTVTDITEANPAVVTTSAAHSFSAGDFVKISIADADIQALTFQVSAPTATTFELKTPDGVDYDTSAKTLVLTGATVSRIYTVTTPYQEEDLFDLVFDQFRDEINITSTDYAPRKLRRFGDTNWTLTETAFISNVENPTSLTATASASGTDALAYGVTTVNAGGQESFLSTVTIAENIVNFSTTAGSVKLTWPAVADITRYNIYRTIFTPTADMTYTQPFGLLGEAFGPQFVDNNIIPDFSRIPPIPDNPFAGGAVLTFSMTAGGSGYHKDTTTVSVSGGTGLEALPIVDAAGEIIAVRILKGGSGYTGGTVTFTDSHGTPGSGATATITTSPATGNWPQCSARIQQRRVYGGTDNLPMNVFGSVPGNEEDFSFASVGSATDAFDLSLDSEQLTPIKYITPASIGFFVFTEKTVFQVRGTDDSIITAQTAVAEPKTQTGCGDVPPLRIGDSVVFLEQGSTGVNSLTPSNLPNFFQLKDNAIYSSQYFVPNNPITSWAHAEIPDKAVWAVRQDGTFLSMTFVPDQNVEAWTDHATDGFVESVAAVRENNFDRVYMIVRRKRGSQFLRYIERFDLNLPMNTEELWAVDSSVVTALNTQSAANPITPSAATGDSVTFTTASAVFSAGDVGKHIRCGNGRALITAFTSSTEVTADIELPITELAPQTKEVKSYTDWSLDEKVSAIEGLWHLEGKTVQIIADGSVEADQVVSAGAVTLQQPSSLVAVGLQYSGDLTTLPLKSESKMVLDKKKRPVDVSVRLLNSRGLLAGARGSNRFYPFKERTFEDYGVPTTRQSGVREIAVVSDWTEDAGITIRKEAPLRATVLGFVINAEVGLD